MAANTFGEVFRVTTFGESHGLGIGLIIDGCPAGLDLDLTFIQHELDRRKPGQSKIVTQRKEDESFVIQSGVFEGKTTGTPISIFIPNTDQKSKDYSHISSIYRPSHADFTYQAKYGVRDYAGGGRSSARETAARVAAGSIAKMILKGIGVKINAFVSQVGHVKLDESETLDLTQTEENMVRCPHPQTAQKMIDLILDVKKSGDTIGGMVSCVIEGCPIGLGAPVFDKLHAEKSKTKIFIPLNTN